MRAAVMVGLVLLAGCGERPSWVRHEHVPYGDTTVNPGATYDAYLPRAGAANAPAVVYIHGGAWRGGDKLMVGVEELAEALCRRGVVMFSVNYRLAPTYRWPAQLEDVQAAWRHLHAVAPQRYGVRRDAMTIMGTSAGGHLAANLYLRTPGAAGCVAEAGEHDLGMAPGAVMADYDSILTDLLGHGPPFAREELDGLSSVRHVRPDARMLLIHATGDPNVYVQQSRALALELERQQADVRFVELPGGQHGGTWRSVDLHGFVAAR